MKHLKDLMSITMLLVICVSPAICQELVAVDESADADFGNYETYTWTSEMNNTTSDANISDQSLNLAIQEAISNELDDLGYTRNSGDPDFIVSYRILKEDTQLQGKPETPNISPMTTAGDELRTYDVEAGTLVVQLLDKEEGTMVWQGFASGILTADDLINNNPDMNDKTLNDDEPQNNEFLKDEDVRENQRSENLNTTATREERVREAVRQIFDKFEYAAR